MALKLANGVSESIIWAAATMTNWRGAARATWRVARKYRRRVKAGVAAAYQRPQAISVAENGALAALAHKSQLIPAKMIIISWRYSINQPRK
jgi:hypothetical protein